jgi:hypothetical protein
MILLAETLTPDTGISIGLILGIAGSLGTALVTGIVSRVLLNVSIKHLRSDLTELTELLEDRTKRLVTLENDKLIRDHSREDRAGLVTMFADVVREAIGHAPQGDSSRSGTRPYPRPPR